MKKRVLCVGDSLGLPRDEVHYDNTWFYLVSDALPTYEFIPRFFRALTSDYLTGSNGKDFLENYSPSVVVMQLGIVDCAPRYFNRSSLIEKGLNIMPSAASKMLWRIFKLAKKRSPNNCYVSPSRFKKNLAHYLNRCKVSGVERVVIIQIAVPSQKMIIRNPRIVEQVHLYNSLITEIADSFENALTVAPLKSGHEVDFCEDGYHINATGNLRIFEALMQSLITE